MIEISTLRDIVAMAGVVIALFYYILNIQHQRKVRQTDIIVRLYSTLINKDFLEAWEKIRGREIKSIEDYRERYISFLEVNQLNTAFGGLGMLLRRNLISLDLINDLTGGAAEVAWEKLRPLNEEVKSGREIESDSFDYLYEEIQKAKRQRKNGQGINGSALPRIE